MRYHVLACDYDGTLATHGSIEPSTLAALERVRASGRRLVLVTGRQLPSLLQVCPQVNLFDAVVVENGAVLYRPSDRTERVLAEPPPSEFIHALHDRGVAPLSIGHVIVATCEPHQTTVLEAIHQLGVELQVIFNKGAVMVLPSGVNKATGLGAALLELGLSSHNAVGVGDAENDHALLSECECAVAVANAIPVLKERVDWVTSGDDGAGVVELIDHLLASDLSELAARLRRHDILLGRKASGEDVLLQPYGVNWLIAGTSGSGKSTLAIGFLERLKERNYQFCVIDPEGDYTSFEGAVVLGDAKRAPLVKEALDVFEDPNQQCIVNLLGVGLDDRPTFFEKLFAALMELRGRTGRPHWILIDETHHLIPASRDSASLGVLERLGGLLMVTVHPDHVAKTLLTAVDVIAAVGEAPADTLRTYSATLGETTPTISEVHLSQGEALVWCRTPSSDPFVLRSIPPSAERQRHLRKYAEGELGEDKSFYFRGPEGKLNLRAQNLAVFLQLADGVDDDTWSYHLHRGDYSNWLREVIKDEALAEEAGRIERTPRLSAQESRARLRERIEERYTGPA